MGYHLNSRTVLLVLLGAAVCLASDTPPSRPDPGEKSELNASERPRRAPKTKRSPYGYIIRGENHVATFQIGAPDDTGLFGNPEGFNAESFHQSAHSFLSDPNGPSFLQSVPGSATNGLNALLAAGTFRSQQSIPNAVITRDQFPSAFNYRQAVFNHLPGAGSLNGAPVLGQKGAPVLPGTGLHPNLVPVPAPPRPPQPPPPPPVPTVPRVAIQPSFQLQPSIQAPPAGNGVSTQYFVLGNEAATQRPDLFNVPDLATLNPLHPFRHPFHNYPTIVTLGVDPTTPGVIATLNPINPPQAFPTLNPPLYTQQVDLRIPQIIPTRTFVQPTLIAPLPPPPPPPPPVLPQVPRPLSNLPKGTFFWFKFNNKNYTLVPNFNDFMKTYQNPLLITRPVQNNLFRPFVHGSRGFTSGPLPVTGKGPVFSSRPSVFDYYPAPTPNFPFDIPFLKAEDESPKEGHPSGKHTTIYHGLAKDFMPTRTRHGPPKTKTPEPESKTDFPVVFPNEDTTEEPGRSEDSTPDDADDLECSDEDITEESIPEDSEDDSSPPPNELPDARATPDETTIKPSATHNDAEVVTKEPRATVIPFDADGIDTNVEPSARPPSFDQKDSDRSDESATSEPTTESSDDDDGNGLAVRRTGKSYRDSDYDQFFVDFTDPNSIQGAGKPNKDSTPATTSTTTTTTTEATTTTTTSTTTERPPPPPPPPTTTSTEAPRVDEYDDYFVDFFDPDPPGLRAKTSVSTSRATTTTTTTTTTAPETFDDNETEPPTTTEEPTAAPPVATPEKEDVPEPTTEEATTTSEATTTEAATTTTISTTTTTELSTTTDQMTTTTDVPTTTTTTEAVTEPADETTTVTTSEATTEAGTDAPITEDQEPTTSSNELTGRRVLGAEVTPSTTTTTTTEQMQTTNGETTSTEGENEIPAKPAEATESEIATSTVEATTLEVGSDATSSTESSQGEPSAVFNVTTDNSQESLTTTAKSAVDSRDEPQDDTLVPSRYPRRNDTTADTDDSTTESIPDVTVGEEESTTRGMGHNLEGRSLVAGAMDQKTDSDEKTDSSTDETTTVPADSTPMTTEAATETSTDITTEALPTTEDTTVPTTSGETTEPPEATATTTTAPTTAATTTTTTTTEPSTKAIEETTPEETTTMDATTTEVVVTTTTTTTSTTTTTTERPASTATTQPTTVSTATPSSNPDDTTKPSMATDSTSAGSSMDEISPMDKGTDRRGKALPVPEDNEEQEGVPKTVLVDGGTPTNYSDVQDNHPVVNDIDVKPSDPRKRRAANWFVWLLDSENIGSSFVDDVGRFASSRDIIYVISGALLVSSVFAMMGLYCTLRSKLPRQRRRIS